MFFWQFVFSPKKNFGEKLFFGEKKNLARKKIKKIVEMANIPAAGSKGVNNIPFITFIQFTTLQGYQKILSIKVGNALILSLCYKYM